MMKNLDLVYMKWYLEFFNVEEKARSTFNALKPALEALTIDPNNAYQEIIAKQYVTVRCESKPKKNLKTF